MTDAGELGGKVALITGSARNMGRAFAEALAGRGANVVVRYHDEASRADAEETARRVEAQGAKALVTSGNVADVAVVRAVFGETMRAFGRVDIVINNAGVIAGAKAPLEDFTRALAWEIGGRGVTVNTVGPGPIDTPFYHGQETAESTAYSMRRSVAGRLGASTMSSPS